MPKINFNVPFLNEKGEPVKRGKVDPDKITALPDGRMQMPFMVEDGNIVMEDVPLRDLIVQTLTHYFAEDSNLSFQERAKRGKLAKKVQNNDAINYTAEELLTIQQMAAKASVSVAFIEQLDAIINPSAEESVV